MTSVNGTNRTISPTLFNSSDLKMSDYRDRRRSIDQQQQQQNRHYDHPNQLQRDQLSPTTECEIEAQGIECGDSNNEDDEEQQLYKRAVASLGPYDVICGRGSAAFNNIGNRRFRILIGINIDRYSNCEGRYRKGRFIGDLVRTFQHEIGARYFKLQDDQLIQLTERQIRQKVGHALRDVLAFQESQNQHRNQLREHNAIENKNIRKSPSITKSKPRIIRYTTEMPRSQAALSSIRSRLAELQSTSDAVRLTNHDLPPLLPTASPTPYTSEKAFPQDLSHAVDCLNRDGTRSQGLTTAFRPSTNLAVKNCSKKTNCFPISTSIEGQTVSVTESARPYRHNRRKEMDRQNGLWSGDTDTAFKSPISNTSKTKNYRDSYKNNNTFNNRQRNTDGPLEDDDFTPIPICEHQEQNNQYIEMFQF
jgi:hypothetical protein